MHLFANTVSALW